MIADRPVINRALSSVLAPEIRRSSPPARDRVRFGKLVNWLGDRCDLLPGTALRSHVKRFNPDGSYGTTTGPCRSKLNADKIEIYTDRKKKKNYNDNTFFDPFQDQRDAEKRLKSRIPTLIVSRSVVNVRGKVCFVCFDCREKQNEIRIYFFRL